MNEEILLLEKGHVPISRINEFGQSIELKPHLKPMVSGVFGDELGKGS